ncbi:MAG: RNA 2',3'-cyclic phosphodiesterase [Candidatus Nanoarchaeia archaeon]
MRCFIAIDFPKEIKEKIKEIQEKLPEFYGKKTEFENLHLTLKFLGEVSKEKLEHINNGLRTINFKRLECSIDSTGVFSEKYIRIVWLHLNGCSELQKQIDEVLEKMFQKEKRFMGHITIARVKSIKDKQRFLKEFKKIKFEKIYFKVNSFYLKRAILKPEGPEYKVLEGFKLA